MSSLKKVVISSNNTGRALAFFADVKARKEEAFKKLDDRTRTINATILKQAIAPKP